MSTNTIKRVIRVDVGEPYSKGDGMGYWRAEADEPGYQLILADCTVFVTDRMLRDADRDRKALEAIEQNTLTDGLDEDEDDNTDNGTARETGS